MGRRNQPLTNHIIGISPTYRAKKTERIAPTYWIRNICFPIIMGVNINDNTCTIIEKSKRRDVECMLLSLNCKWNNVQYILYTLVPSLSWGELMSHNYKCQPDIIPYNLKLMKYCDNYMFNNIINTRYHMLHQKTASRSSIIIILYNAVSRP